MDPDISIMKVGLSFTQIYSFPGIVLWTLEIVQVCVSGRSRGRGRGRGQVKGQGRGIHADGSIVGHHVEAS